MTPMLGVVDSGKLKPKTTIVGIGNGTTGATGGVYSTDGGTIWTGFTIPATTGANIDSTGMYLVYGQGKFVLVPYNQNNFYYSSTGYSSWTSVAAPVAAYKGGAVGYVPSVGFVALSHGSGGNTAYSTNGTSWTAGSGGPNVGISLGYVNGTWFTNRHNDPNGYYSTNLGSTWTNNGSFSGPPYFGTFGFAASNGTTAVFNGQYGSSDTLWTTTTGTSITASTMPSTSSWYGSQCWGYEANIYVASGSTTAAASSTNGTTWTARTRISGGTANLTVYAADTGFVAVSAQSGAGGAVQKSSDGLTWTSLTGSGTGVYCWTLCSAQVRNYSKTAV